jgi:hypothetical protein
MAAGRLRMMFTQRSHVSTWHPILARLASEPLECASCPRAQCQCTEPVCRCDAHTHYRRCDDCARGNHATSSVTVRSAYAFSDWPPDGYAHLRHLLSDKVH